MMRHFASDLTICVVAALPFLLLAMPSDAQTPSREDARKILGPDGGTILVYEIHRRNKDDKLGDAEAKRLAGMLKQQINPKDLFDLSVRPSGTNRIEIVLPTKGKRAKTKDLTAEDVLRIKHLVSQVGNLEFRILANRVDDKTAMEDATKLINRGTAEVGKALEKAQLEGTPPPGPRAAGLESEPKAYDLVLAKGAKCRVTYTWVELGPQEVRQLNLDDAAKDDPKRKEIWNEAADSRGKAALLSDPGADQAKLLHGALFYSRECKDRNLPDEERRKKPIEYFVLARNPEIIDGKAAPMIDASYLIEAHSTLGLDKRPVVHFSFNNAGGELFGALTRKNVSDDTTRRHLAVILDGMVMTAPTINSEIRTQGQISANFTQKEVDGIVNSLRAGRLPVTLQPRPIAEITIEPAKK